jgi:hypothetical protein
MTDQTRGRGRVRGHRRTYGRGSGLRRVGLALTSAALIGGLLFVPATAWSPLAYAEQVDSSGEVIGADVEGTIWLNFDPNGGPLSGRIEMTVQFDCRGKIRDEHHIMEITKGSIDGDRIQATAVYVERSGLPKDELSRCKSAYETYQTREDSRRLIGTVDAEGQRASGTLGEYRPTVTWQIAWQPPAPPEELPVQGEPAELPATDPSEPPPAEAVSGP